MKIAALTGGGVAPGMNAAVRAVAQTAFGRGWKVVGVELGYAGLQKGRFRCVDSGTLSGWMSRGGTMLGTERSVQGNRIERVPLEKVVAEDHPIDPGLYKLAGALARIPRQPRRTA